VCETAIKVLFKVSSLVHSKVVSFILSLLDNGNYLKHVNRSHCFMYFGIKIFLAKHKPIKS
jgi:hypothetical protein